MSVPPLLPSHLQGKAECARTDSCNLAKVRTTLEASDQCGCAIQGGHSTGLPWWTTTAILRVTPTLEERLTPACTHAHDMQMRLSESPQCYQPLTFSIICFDHVSVCKSCLTDKCGTYLTN